MGVIEQVCAEANVDVCVTTRGYTATEPPAEPPEVTVTKTEAGNTVIGKRKPATGGAIAETVVNTDAFKEAVESLVTDNIREMLQSTYFEAAVGRVIDDCGVYDTAKFNTAITRNVKDDLDRDGIIANAIAYNICRGGTVTKALAERFEGSSRCE